MDRGERRRGHHRHHRLMPRSISATSSMSSCPRSAKPWCKARRSRWSNRSRPLPTSIAPVSGEVTAVNQAVVDQPGLVNDSAEDRGWFFKLKLADPGELEIADGPHGLRSLLRHPGLRTIRSCAICRSPSPTVAPCSPPSAWAASTTCSSTCRPRRAWTPPVDLPHHAGELEVERRIAAFAARNLSAGSVPFFLGAGAYRHHVPATVDALIQRGEFLTSYTPYQPEVSQGTLQDLFEFQTQVALLTGMEVANASMYDGATATAEAVAMAYRVTKRPPCAGVGQPPSPLRAPPPRPRCNTLVTRSRSWRPIRWRSRICRPHRRPTPPASSCRIPASSAGCAIFAAGGHVPRGGRAAGRGGGRAAVARRWSRRRARWAPTSSWPRARASATGSISAAPVSACSPPARNSCARCRAGSPARPRTPTAGAAGC